MANNTTLNTMTGGDVIADEDITSVKYQRIKLVDGTVGQTTPIPGDANGLHTVPHIDATRVVVTSAGLTIATTAYTSGDQMGSLITFAGCARNSGGGGRITKALVTSAADQIGPIDLLIFDTSVTLAADNAAFAITDADALKIVGLIQCQGAYDIGNNRIAQAYNIYLPYQCSVTSLYGALITRSGHTFFAAATDLEITISIERN